ncbi:hypothetical protein D9M71_795790 [compost metagenome]
MHDQRPQVLDPFDGADDIHIVHAGIAHDVEHLAIGLRLDALGNAATEVALV